MYIFMISLNAIHNNPFELPPGLRWYQSQLHLNLPALVNPSCFSYFCITDTSSIAPLFHSLHPVCIWVCLYVFGCSCTDVLPRCFLIQPSYFLPLELYQHIPHSTPYHRASMPILCPSIHYTCTVHIRARLAWNPATSAPQLGCWSQHLSIVNSSQLASPSIPQLTPYIELATGFEGGMATTSYHSLQ